MIIIILVLFFMPYATVLSMENGTKYWICWNNEKRAYEHRRVSQYGLHRRAELDNTLKRIDRERQYREILADPCAMQTVAQQAKTGCPVAQRMVADAVTLPENQYNVLRHLIWRSIDEHRKQQYGLAFAHLRNVRKLLVSASQETRSMLQHDKNTMEEYQLYLQIDINLTRYLAKITGDDEYEHGIEPRNHYIKLFKAILKSIRISQGRAGTV